MPRRRATEAQGRSSQKRLHRGALRDGCGPIVDKPGEFRVDHRFAHRLVPAVDRTTSDAHTQTSGCGPILGTEASAFRVGHLVNLLLHQRRQFRVFTVLRHDHLG
ncbi:MAG TPA: hypothetical protein VLM40_07880 [Gemmata sp.]|nr:hypothetical protein [Gemmata sp.]